MEQFNKVDLGVESTGSWSDFEKKIYGHNQTASR